VTRVSDSTENLPVPADNGRGKRRQAVEAAALALASGKTYKAAAKRAGIGERTLYRWARQPGFKRRVGELRGRLVNAAVGRLSKSMGAAAGVLRTLLKSEDEDVKFKAARAVLELGTKIREAAEIEDRLADLERQAAGRAK
jgi:hypothetical protein